MYHNNIFYGRLGWRHMLFFDNMLQEWRVLACSNRHERQGLTDRSMGIITTYTAACRWCMSLGRGVGWYLAYNVHPRRDQGAPAEC